MLETPLFGRFSNEDRLLVFSAPVAYHTLVRSCVIGGSVASVYGLLAPVIGYETPFYPSWWLYTGAAVALSGVLAAYSLVMIRLDMKSGTYKRREGSRGFGTTTSGPLSDLDALVMIAEPNSRMTPNGVTYHLMLHWKGGKEPPMVLQQDTRPLPVGQPLNIWAQPLRERGMHYAKALKIPFYDNAHFASACPVRLMSR